MAKGNTKKSFLDYFKLNDSSDEDFDDDLFDYVELAGESLGYVEVYPTHFLDHISIYTDCVEPQHYEMYDALGAKVMEGNYSGSVIIDTNHLISGSYIIKTVGKSIRLLKSE